MLIISTLKSVAALISNQYALIQITVLPLYHRTDTIIHHDSDKH